MCEAEKELSRVYLWLRDNHNQVYLELSKLDAEKARKEAFG